MLSNGENNGGLSWPGHEPHAHSSKINSLPGVASPTRRFSVSDNFFIRRAVWEKQDGTDGQSYCFHNPNAFLGAEAMGK
jgi:hypothetical protein